MLDILKQPKIVNRFKSFAWRTGMMIIAGLVDFVIASLSDFNLSNEQVVLAGLVLGEISKYLSGK